jgi:hypothetical protein
MSGMKHLFVIHGRSTKPSEKEKARITRQSLLHGLDRGHSEVAARIRQKSGSGRVKLSFIYYGDISNALILERNPSKANRLSGTDPAHGNAKCEPDAFYDEGLKLLYAHNSHNKSAYKKLLRDNPDARWIDNVASVISVLGNLSGLSDRLISAATADLGAYLLTRKTGSAIRERLQKPLRKALLNGDDVCLLSHSMGCMVSYDVLWKFSQMSEYRDVQDSKRRISKWITLGNPLGEPGVRKNLYDADEPDDGRYPKNIIKGWVNLSAQDDFICHDSTVKDDFKEMKKWGYVESISDRKIYNFWLGRKTSNPHKFYGYLDNPYVAREVADWANTP